MIGPKVARPTATAERIAYEIVNLRDANTCQRCHRDCGHGYVSRDHRKNRSQGGLTVASNLQLLGGTGTMGCHGWVTENPRQAVAEGWAVPGYGDPAQWPARRWVSVFGGVLRLQWVLYDNTGGWDVIGDLEALRRMEDMGWRAE